MVPFVCLRLFLSLSLDVVSLFIVLQQKPKSFFCFFLVAGYTTRIRKTRDFFGRGGDAVGLKNK